MSTAAEQDGGTGTEAGTVYIVHFDTPYKHARHYTGWATDLVLAAIQGERRWRGCVFAGERGFRGGSGCGGVACDDSVSVSDKGRPSPLSFC
jgi:hypothetical protein